LKNKNKKKKDGKNNFYKLKNWKNKLKKIIFNKIRAKKGHTKRAAPKWSRHKVVYTRIILVTLV